MVQGVSGRRGENAMKGIKAGLLGVCLGIAGLAAASYNMIAMAFAFAGVAVAIAAFFVKD